MSPTQFFAVAVQPPDAVANVPAPAVAPTPGGAPPEVFATVMNDALHPVGSGTPPISARTTTAGGPGKPNAVRLGTSAVAPRTLNSPAKRAGSPASDSAVDSAQDDSAPGQSGRAGAVQATDLVLSMLIPVPSALPILPLAVLPASATALTSAPAVAVASTSPGQGSPTVPFVASAASEKAEPPIDGRSVRPKETIPAESAVAGEGLPWKRLMEKPSSRSRREGGAEGQGVGPDAAGGMGPGVERSKASAVDADNGQTGPDTVLPVDFSMSDGAKEIPIAVVPSSASQVAAVTSETGVATPATAVADFGAAMEAVPRVHVQPVGLTSSAALLPAAPGADEPQPADLAPARVGTPTPTLNGPVKFRPADRIGSGRSMFARADRPPSPADGTDEPAESMAVAVDGGPARLRVANQDEGRLVDKPMLVAGRRDGSAPEAVGPGLASAPAGTPGARLANRTMKTLEAEQSAGWKLQGLPPGNIDPLTVSGEQSRPVDAASTARFLRETAALFRPHPVDGAPSNASTLFGAGEASGQATMQIGAAERAERVGHLILKEASVVRQSGAESLAVVLKPDAQTELFLQLTHRGGQMEAVVRFDRGDAAALGAHWPQLQESLARLDIQLQPLKEVLASLPGGNPQESGSFSFSGGQDSSSSQRRTPPAVETADGTVPAKQNSSRASGRAAEPPSRRRAGWESWA